MKTPMTLGQKKAKMIEQLLEELGVGEDIVKLCILPFIPVYPISLHLQVFVRCLLSRYVCSLMNSGGDVFLIFYHHYVTFVPQTKIYNIG